MQRGASEKKKKAVAVVEPNKGGEAEVEAEAQPKQVIASVAQLGPCLSTNFKTLLCDQVSARQERIINMIDALLGEEEEGKEEMLHCRLDSIDRIGDSHLLPLQFGKES